MAELEAGGRAGRRCKQLLDVAAQNDVSRWQFWAEEGKTMSEYVSKHSAGRGVEEVKANPRRKVRRAHRPFLSARGKFAAHGNGAPQPHHSFAHHVALRACALPQVIMDASASTFAFYWSAGVRAHRAFQAVQVQPTCCLFLSLSSRLLIREENRQALHTVRPPHRRARPPPLLPPRRCRAGASAARRSAATRTSCGRAPRTSASTGPWQQTSRHASAP